MHIKVERTRLHHESFGVIITLHYSALSQLNRHLWPECPHLRVQHPATGVQQGCSRVSSMTLFWFDKGHVVRAQGLFVQSCRSPGERLAPWRPQASPFVGFLLVVLGQCCWRNDIGAASRAFVSELQVSCRSNQEA